MAPPEKKMRTEPTEECLVYSNDYSENRFKLFEVSPEILKEIEAGTSLVLKGGAKEDAVLCTASKTFSIKKVETSNSLLLLPPKEDGLRDSNGSLPTRPVAGACTWYYELVHTAPRIEGLKNLVSECPYVGEAGEARVENDATLAAKRYTFEQLLERTAASEEETRTALRLMGAILIHGRWRMMPEAYSDWVLDSALAVMMENDMDMGAVDVSKVTDLLLRLEAGGELVPHALGGVDAPAVAHVLRLQTYPPQQEQQMEEQEAGQVGGDEKEKEKGVSSAGLLSLRADRVASFRARQLLAAEGRRANPWPVDEFVEAWTASMLDASTPDMALLKRYCLEERRAGVRVLVPVDRAALPLSPAARFRHLFQLRERWTLSDLQPFIDDLVVQGQSEASLLRSFTRSSLQPGSTDRLYTER